MFHIIILVFHTVNTFIFLKKRMFYFDQKRRSQIFKRNLRVLQTGLINVVNLNHVDFD